MNIAATRMGLYVIDERINILIGVVIFDIGLENRPIDNDFCGVCEGRWKSGCELHGRSVRSYTHVFKGKYFDFACAFSGVASRI